MNFPPSRSDLHTFPSAVTMNTFSDSHNRDRLFVEEDFRAAEQSEMIFEDPPFFLPRTRPL
jgi:hypothetical protein